MTRDEIVKLAKLCELGRVCGPLDYLLDDEWEDLHRFAQLAIDTELKKRTTPSTSTKTKDKQDMQSMQETQPKALDIAKRLEFHSTTAEGQNSLTYIAIGAAKELRHLHEVNMELLNALQEVVNKAEQVVSDKWFVLERPSGDAESTQRQWEESSDYIDFCNDWADVIAIVDKATGNNRMEACDGY